MDKYELARKIQETELLTNEEKSELLRLLREQKKYGIVWEDKPEEVEQRLKEELPILTEVKERALISDNPDAPNHILIEGDNLEALTALTYTHSGKIDVIYIDPPYNTGNRDFVYNDSFVDKEDGYRHSKWLSFMNKRLKIAKQLLSEKGVIFISIDDNEQAQLKMLCDEVFGITNFAANVIWEKADSPRMDAKLFSSRHDHIIVYCKQIDTLPIRKLRISDIPDHYNKTDEKGKKYYLKPLRYMGNADAREDRPNLYFPLIAPDGTYVFPKRADGSDGRWRWSKTKFEEEKERVEFLKTKNGWSVNSRIYAQEESEVPVETIWYNKDVESNRNAIATIKQIFGDEKTFTNPKPIKLIDRILKISTHRNSFILDFFAGSGTTLHATMQLNADDGGHRQCILVTNNENNICEEVTYERNKRVIQGYATPRGEQVAGLKNNNLRYYKTNYTSRKRDIKSMRKLMHLATDMLCVKENLYEEHTQFGNISTVDGIFRYFDDGKKQMLIIYREEAIEELVEELFNMTPKDKIKVYVFSPSEDPWEGEFADVAEKVDLTALPFAIYNAYKRLPFMKKNQHFGEKEEEQETVQEHSTVEVDATGQAAINFNE